MKIKLLDEINSVNKELQSNLSQIIEVDEDSQLLMGENNIRKPDSATSL